MKIKLLDAPILKALLDDSMYFHDVMNAYGIKTSIAFNLPAAIYGFVYKGIKGNYLLVLNGNINYKTQCEVFLHEIKHIISDMPNIGYIIGLDMQHTVLETEHMFV
ncbi:MAG: hypothetical protein A2Y23_11790 [Clostridiales bacterium GWB2_37_7]|nr:MAG: hypothetical protein A2Y23_11790 [Clostridiales bacterium GWB2_37_7]